MLPNLGTVASVTPGETYYFDDFKLGGGGAAVTPPPTATDTVLASFDETSALAFVGFNGGEGSAVVAGPTGGSANAAKVLRTGGDPWAGAKVTVSAINLSSANHTISARVYSPTAGTPMVLKLEGTGISTGDMQAVETVVVGWQTLTWVVPTSAISTAYKDIVMLPNLGTVASVTPGETYYFDDFKLVGGGASTGTGGGTSVTPNPTAEMGSGGAVTLPVATAGDAVGFVLAGDGVFASDYVGAMDTNNLHASWTNAVTSGNGNIGYFNDPAMSTATVKLDENGWIASGLDNPGGIGNFFRYFVFTGTAAPFANSYMGMFANSPNNGTVDVSTYGNIKLKLWGPAEMYQQSNFNPTVELILTGPKVAGCTATGSGGTEISKTFVANQKIGAGSSYKIPLAAWTVKGVCGSDSNATAVSAVLGSLARVVVNVPGSSFNFTNASANSSPAAYATGVNLGPIAFTNN